MRNKFFPDKEITEAGQKKPAFFVLRNEILMLGFKIKNEYLRIFVYNNR